MVSQLTLEDQVRVLTDADREFSKKFISVWRLQDDDWLGQLHFLLHSHPAGQVEAVGYEVLAGLSGDLYDRPIPIPIRVPMTEADSGFSLLNALNTDEFREYFMDTFIPYFPKDTNLDNINYDALKQFSVNHARNLIREDGILQRAKEAVHDGARHKNFSMLGLNQTEKALTALVTLQDEGREKAKLYAMQQVIQDHIREIVEDYAKLTQLVPHSPTQIYAGLEGYIRPFFEEGNSLPEDVFKSLLADFPYQGVKDGETGYKRTLRTLVDHSIESARKIKELEVKVDGKLDGDSLPNPSLLGYKVLEEEHVPILRNESNGHSYVHVDSIREGLYPNNEYTDMPVDVGLRVLGQNLQASRYIHGIISRSEFIDGIPMVSPSQDGTLREIGVVSLRVLQEAVENNPEGLAKITQIGPKKLRLIETMLNNSSQPTLNSAYTSLHII